MEISNKISQSIIAAATGMFQPFIPDLTPTRLIDALKQFDAETNATAATSARPQRPYTVAEVQELLGVSKPTIYRMFKDGSLTQLKIREGITRIPAAEVEALMTGASPDQSTKS